jgi:hypothetical protein
MNTITNFSFQTILIAVGILAIFFGCSYLIIDSSTKHKFGWQCDINIQPATYTEPYLFDKEIK